MKELAKASFPIERVELDHNSALSIFEEMNESYKVEIISDIDDNETLSAYKQGDFIDLCRGPHLPSTNKMKYFKLLGSAGAYWRGDETNKMLQRIYGTAWFSKDDLKDYLFRVEEAKKRDHRKLGKELSIFAFDD